MAGSTETGTTVAVTVAIRNEGPNVDRLIDALQAQIAPPQEIIFVDDGSTDDTVCRLRRRAESDPRIVVLSQANAGPATARNAAWRAARSSICAFTDGDCVPDDDWLARLLPPFTDQQVLATAGSYRTLNADNLLAAFIGAEIAWRYRAVGKWVDCHGTYNLAVRRATLAALEGFDERYRQPSGEDFDLTYRISARGRIAFVRDAVVGHYHPEEFGPYLIGQARRARDRVLLYADHRGKFSSDSYTSSLDKYQALAAWILLPIPVVAALNRWLAVSIAAAALAFLVATTLPRLLWISRRVPRTALVGFPVVFLRSFAWGWGVLAGLAFRIGRTRSSKGS
jgi:cellulose synthase/poly-beta-1,6-N-acetylglucosamine synthase-like glycosyltransferase